MSEKNVVKMREGCNLDSRNYPKLINPLGLFRKLLTKIEISLDFMSTFNLGNLYDHVRSRTRPVTLTG